MFLGNDAFWVPPRLWAYAAGNQPDGIFEDYSAEEIAMLIGYQGDAKAMLQAMLQASFMDKNPLRIHDWQEHNGVHTVFAQRAKAAANARWEKERERTKEREEKKVQYKTRQEPSIASSMLEASAAAGDDLGQNWESAKGWLAQWQKNGADYTEFEARTAFLALQASGWMWGRNRVADPRAALERQIQSDRERKQIHGPKESKTANPRLAGVSRNPINNYAEAAKRKMAGQVASPQNGPPSKAEGT